MCSQGRKRRGRVGREEHPERAAQCQVSAPVWVQHGAVRTSGSMESSFMMAMLVSAWPRTATGRREQSSTASSAWGRLCRNRPRCVLRPLSRPGSGAG